MFYCVYINKNNSLRLVFCGLYNEIEKGFVKMQKAKVFRFRGRYGKSLEVQPFRDAFAGKGGFRINAKERGAGFAKKKKEKMITSKGGEAG